MTPVTYSRIYQGRVVSAQALTTTGKGKAKQVEAAKLPDWEQVLWDHHQMFQDGVNYYLLALVVAAGESCPELKGLWGQVESAWDGFRGKGGRVYHSLRQSVGPWLGLGPGASFEDAVAAVLAGSEASAEVRQLAVRLLLAKAQGDSGIQQNGRGYWPRFCASAARPTWDYSASTRDGEIQGKALQLAVWGELSDGARSELAGRCQLAWVVKVDAEKEPRRGAAARERLLEAVKHFSDGQNPPRVTEWLRAQPDAADQLQELSALIAALPDEVSVPVNRKAAPERTFATLLFMHCPCAFTQGLLALVLGEPKKEKAPQANKPERMVDEIDFGAFGDDPIKLARGARGYVFPAFTALPQWQPEEGGKPSWSELDIALFKEALKVLNQFRLKTSERELKKQAALMRLGHMLQGGRWASEEAEPTVIPPWAQEQLRVLEKVLLPPDLSEEEKQEQTYTFSERALRGLGDLLEKWQKIAPEGTAFSEGKHAQLEKALLDHQEAHAESMGSAALYWTLISGSAERGEKAAAPSGKYWQLWQDEDELIHAWGEKQELERDLRERLEKPIRFTPADAVHSRRLFMASDLNGRSGSTLHQVDGQPVVDLSLALHHEGRWQEQRVRLLYSAPRLRRDEIESEGRWLPPKLAAMLALEEAPKQDFAGCAVALMPEGIRLEEGDRPKRFLLNFPLSLDVTELPGRALREDRWKGQFNSAEDVPLYLHWPSTRELSTSKVVKTVKPWHDRLTEFSCLGVDLGQRAAAAVARLQVSTQKPDGRHSWDVGESSRGKAWHAQLITQRVLRLPGEDAEVFDQKRAAHEAVQEKGGSVGRRATEEECAEAQGMLDALNLSEEFRLVEAEGKKLRAPYDAQHYFPAQNDHLLRAYRRAQGHLMRLQNWLYLLKQKPDGEEKSMAKVEAAVTEVQRARFADNDLPENPTFAELRRLGTAKNWPEMERYLAEQVNQRRSTLSTQLAVLANRVLPLPDGHWEWAAMGENHVLKRVRKHLEQTPKVRGQRGLSLARIEQLEELRRRCQSLNRALKRGVGERAKFGRDTRDEELPDPCPDLLEKLDEMRTQRVNQTAHLILAEALGLRLKAPSRRDRVEKDIHGEYEKVREPVDFIVMENLDRYLTSQGRAPSENSRLMKWCHRAITEKLKLLCEPLGMTVVEVGAAYSSRFCSKTGVAGFRANPIGWHELRERQWQKWLQEAKERGAAAGELAKQAAELKQLWVKLNHGLDELTTPTPEQLSRQKTLLWPKAGGAFFVPMQGKPQQSDLNAAINIALRGIAAPDRVTLLHRLRAIPQEGGALLPGGTQMNLREKALFGAQAKQVKPFSIEASAEKSEKAKRGANFFPDTARLADFGRANHPALPALPLASGKGLWSAVKTGAWGRCMALNLKLSNKTLQRLE